MLQKVLLASAISVLCMTGTASSKSTLSAKIVVTPSQFPIDHPGVLTVEFVDASVGHNFTFGLGACMVTLAVTALVDGKETKPPLCSEIMSLASRVVPAGQTAQVQYFLRWDTFPGPGAYRVRVVALAEEVGPLMYGHEAEVSSNSVDVTVLPALDHSLRKMKGTPAGAPFPLANRPRYAQNRTLAVVHRRIRANRTASSRNR